MGPMTLLTVRGRNTGKPRTTPVAIIELEGKRYMASFFGAANWVRNLRATGEGILKHGRRSEAITVVELTPQEAAPILKESLASAPSFVRRYFDATPDSPVEDFEREALRHPVFLVNEVKRQVADRTSHSRTSLDTW
jgi:deazaflavin-dependent oxidoreductase (nitroreductase family)